MCVKKYSHSIPYQQNQLQAQEQIINELRKIKFTRGIDAFVPISYLIKKTKLDKRIVYNSVDYLVDQGIIEMFIISSCPICYEWNLQKYEGEKVKCRHCNEMYNGYDAIEKYRIKD